MFLNSHAITPKQNTLKHKRKSQNLPTALIIETQSIDTTVAIPNEEFSGNMQELDEKVKSMMVLSHNMLPSGKQRAYVCQVCGKEGGSTPIKDHIESNHIDGISIPCNMCEKTFRSRAALRHHKSKQHE